MWTFFWFAATVVCAMGWLTNKIGLLTILLYFTERGVELPNHEEIRMYREKVVKKLMHIKED